MSGLVVSARLYEDMRGLRRATTGCALDFSYMASGALPGWRRRRGARVPDPVSAPVRAAMTMLQARGGCKRFQPLSCNRMHHRSCGAFPVICTEQMNVHTALHLHEMSGKMRLRANREGWYITADHKRSPGSR